jgi:hypothetical protein
LHTPRVTEIPEKPSKFAQRTGDRSERCFPNLTSQVLYGGLLKTPTVMDGVITTGKKNPESGNTGTLAQEIASGYIYRRGILPTPTTQEIEHPNAIVSPTGRRMAKNGNSHSLGLADLVKFLPTPKACDGMGGIHKVTGRTVTRPSGHTFSVGLRDLAGSGLLPTPRANVVNGLDLSNPNIAKRNNGNLEEAISALLISGTAQECGVAFQLSPLFVEEMMGFPTGWILMPFLKESSAPQEPHLSSVGAPNP